MEKNTLESALKEFSQTSGTNANDVKEFFALMSDGSIKRMPKEDMATVLGELVGINELISQEIDNGVEIDLGNPGYGIYLVTCVSFGDVGLYKIGSYNTAYLHGIGTDDNSTFGDYSTNDTLLIFGRKSTNSNIFIKNNSGSTKNIRIRRIARG